MELSDLFVSYKQVSPPKIETKVQDVELPNFSMDRLKQFIDNKSTENKQDNNLSFQGWKFSSSNPSSGNDIIKFFIDKGLSEHLARGIYGNLMQESGLKLDALGDDGTSYGIALWRNDRRTALHSKYGENPDLTSQLNFIWDELNGSENKALEALRKTTTVEEATESFMNNYERPNTKYADLEKRIKYANS